MPSCDPRKGAPVIKLGVIDNAEGKVSAEIEKMIDIRGYEGIREIYVLGTAQPLEGSELTLLVIAPEMTAAVCGQRIACQILLTPDAMVTERIETPCVVGYGMSAQDTLTLSSVGEKSCILALQREIELSGYVLERQEMTVSRPKGLTPEETIAVMGTMMIIAAAEGDAVMSE